MSELFSTAETQRGSSAIKFESERESFEFTVRIFHHRDAKFLARHSRNQIEKQGFTTENAEFAEIFYFKVCFSESSAPPR
jgi:hypothetical protein